MVYCFVRPIVAVAIRGEPEMIVFESNLESHDLQAGIQEIIKHVDSRTTPDTSSAVILSLDRDAKARHAIQVFNSIRNHANPATVFLCGLGGGGSGYPVAPFEIRKDRDETELGILADRNNIAIDGERFASVSHARDHLSVIVESCRLTDERLVIRLTVGNDVSVQEFADVVTLLAELGVFSPDIREFSTADVSLGKENLKAPLTPPADKSPRPDRGLPR